MEYSVMIITEPGTISLISRLTFRLEVNSHGKYLGDR